MVTWLPIVHRGYWDVPRVFLVWSGGRLYLFDGSFSEALDDYPDDYSVYLLPSETREDDLPADWTALSARAIRQLGTVPVARVQFDETRRKQVNAAVLDELAASLQT